ncbi:MAG: hypothetical protein SWC40_12020 [Thermodesulfobacteriota bacterium]|nr:hypothetical protein [Thermodesulfobacteriota bacterium]
MAGETPPRKEETQEEQKVFVVDEDGMEGLNDIFGGIDSGRDAGKGREASEEDENEVELAPPPKPPGRPRLNFKPQRFSALGIGVFLLILLIGGFLLRPDGGDEGKAMETVAVVRRPIEVPVFERKIEFFIPAQSEDGFDILSLVVVFEFHSAVSEERIEAIEPLLRDAAYLFLVDQRPEKNALKHWASIVENELRAHLEEHSFKGRLMLERLERI